MPPGRGPLVGSDHGEDERQATDLLGRMSNGTRALPELEIEDYVRDRWRAARG
jgi:hypothetical protein